MATATAMLRALSDPGGDSRLLGRGLIGTLVLCSSLFLAVGTPAQQQGITEVGHSGKSIFTTFEAPGAAVGAVIGAGAGSVIGMLLPGRKMIYSVDIPVATNGGRLFSHPDAGGENQ